MINTLVGYKGGAAQSRIVDKNVEMPIVDTGGIDQMLHLCLISYISSNSQRLVPKLSQFFRYRVDRLTRAGGQNDFRTCLGETARSLPALLPDEAPVTTTTLPCISIENLHWLLVRSIFRGSRPCTTIPLFLLP